MIDKYFGWNIDGIQANTVLKGAEIEVQIDMANNDDIFISKELRKILESNRMNLNALFRIPGTSFYSSIVNEFRLTYYNKDGKYRFKYDYETIFNNILKMLGAQGNIELKDINDENEYKKFVLKIRKELALLAEVREHDGKNNVVTDHIISQLFDKTYFIIENMLNVEREINYYFDKQVNEEKITRENHKQLKTCKEKHISWKNLMYYTSVKALHNFYNTDNIEYYRYAKNFYKNLGCNPTAEHPNGINVDGKFYSCNYDEYNTEFLAIQNMKFSPILVRLGVEDKTTVTLDRTLKSGKGLRAEINLDGPKTYKTVDPDKVEASLKRKITFYKGLSGKVQGIIRGLDTDTDYIGYVLPNNYVIFDKFYEVSRDGAKVSPSYGNRVYVVTLDVLEACGRDKTKMGAYIAEHHDFKAARYNHNDTDSYQDKVREALDYHDVSTVKYKEYVLRHENNKYN